MSKDSQSRKWQVTINNPIEKGFTHDKIKEELQKIKSCIYWCMSDEIGIKENTMHTHIFIACSSAVRFSSVKNRFPPGHTELARGTCEQNRDYVFKIGKFEKDKSSTRIPDTQEELGELPIERQGARNDLVDLYDQIKSGASNYQILEDNPDHMLHIDKIERVRQTIKAEEFKNVFRKMEVTYIWGPTGTGKTRFVLEGYGYENVFRVSDYKHPFDGYQGQDVLVLEEFHSQLPLPLVLNICDGYPLELPCRYNNKTACFTKIYIISNIELADQYPYERDNEPNTWAAFRRRIHKIIKFPQNANNNEFNNRFIEVDIDIQNPFAN